MLDVLGLDATEEGAYRRLVALPSASAEDLAELMTSSVSALATALSALEDKGLVTSKYGDPTPERGGRAKRYFTVTARGVRAVARAQRAYQRLLHGLVLPGGAHA